MNATAETLRLLHNLVTVGTVSAVEPPRMRLTIGDNETDWVKIPALAAGKVKVWRCPTIGEQYIIVSPSGDHRNARPICTLPSDDFPAPSTNPDEVRIQFNDADYISIDTTGSSAKLKISNFEIDGFIQSTKNADIAGNLSAGNGVTGVFTTNTGKVVTVTNGIVTNIF